MRAMLLGLAALLAATAVASAADISVVYLVDRSALMSAKAADALIVDLYGDAECGAPLYATTLAVADLTLVERVSTLHLRGMPHHPRAARLVLPVPNVPPLPAYWARIEGRHVRPLGSPCQPQVAPVQTSLPCLRQDGTNVVVEGCNVHVRNGTGDTTVTNGLGNLVVGYEDAGVAGSHNVLIGGPHEVDGYGNVLVGVGHRASGAYNLATGLSDQVSGEGNVVLGGNDCSVEGVHTGILGGNANSAQGDGAVVVGGAGNMAVGDGATTVGGTANGSYLFSTTVAGSENYAQYGGIVLGGTRNYATGVGGGSELGYPMIVGGADNVTMSDGSSVFAGSNDLADNGGAVLGGKDNAALRRGALVVGGSTNRAGALASPPPVDLPTDSFDVVIGGTYNSAIGVGTLVSGGSDNEATGTLSVVSGGSSNRADGTWAAVFGGAANTAHGEASTVGGGLERVTDGPYDWRAGELFQDQ